MTAPLAPAYPEDPRATAVVFTLRVLKLFIQQLSLAIAGDAALVPPSLQYRLARGEGTDFSFHVSDMLSLGFDESGAVTRKPIGVLVVSPSCLAYAQEVNFAKSAFAEACRGFLKSRNYATGRKQLSELFQSERMFTISLRQAYKDLVVVDHPVHQIGFTVSRKNRTIKPVSYEQAVSQLIYRFGDEHGARIVAIVDLFERSGAPLYSVWNSEPRLSANLTFEDGSTKMIHAHSLILVPYGRNPIQCNIGSDKDWDVLFADRIRATRRDRRIGSTPIIPNTSLYTHIDFENLCVTVPFAEPKRQDGEEDEE